MKSLHFRAFFAILWLVFTLSAGAQSTPAQTPATPPAPSPTAPPLLQAPLAGRQQPEMAAPTSKMMPTGIAAYGAAITQDVYTNSIYGLSLHIPPGWVVVPVKTNLEKSAPGGALQSHLQEINAILMVTENAPVKKPYQRKSIQVMATHTLVEPGAATAEDYLKYSEKTAKVRGMAVNYKGRPRPVTITINGQSFSKVEMELSTSGGEQHAEPYVTIEQQNLPQFLFVSPDEAGLKDLKPSIQSLKFKTVGQKTRSKTTKSRPASPKPTPSN
jgi:hypothetical protein